MDDNSKQASSYQLDQEILDARGINMTVEEVAGLSTVKYAEKVQNLHLSEDNLMFLKGLRRRIKNRLASQNSRRRSVEQLRQLTRELRVVRACREDALAERRALLKQRTSIQERCRRLRQYVVQILQERSDSTNVPTVDLSATDFKTDVPKENPRVSTEHTDLTSRDVFECRIDKLVQQSVNHIFKNDRMEKKICAKTVFLSNENTSNVKSVVMDLGDSGKLLDYGGGVLNLSVKERKSHGRKQSAPRRIAYACDSYDDVLDLKVKKEAQ